MDMRMISSVDFLSKHLLRVMETDRRLEVEPPKEQGSQLVNTECTNRVQLACTGSETPKTIETIHAQRDKITRRLSHLTHDTQEETK